MLPTRYRGLGEGLGRNAEGAKEWLCSDWQSWRPLEVQDRDLFSRVKDAAFLYRLGLGRHNARRLFGVELVFRSGERVFLHEIPAWAQLATIVAEADGYIARCPALAADAICEGRSNRSLADWLQLSDIDVYVDGSGSFHVGEELVALRNCADVNPWWRQKIIAENREYRGEFARISSEVNMLVDEDKDTGEPVPANYGFYDIKFRQRR